MSVVDPTFINPTWRCLQRWWNAVDTAGFGFFDAATHELATMTADCRGLSSPDGFLVAALALTTQASWERQMGKHTMAAQLDDKALEILQRNLPHTAEGMDRDSANYIYFIALADAVSGRAADCLGVEGVEAARQWVNRGDAILVKLQEMIYPDSLNAVIEKDSQDTLWGHCGLNAPRVVIRHAWVSTETAMGEGRWEHAQVCAQQGVELSGEWLSPRHYVKSLLVEAAANSGTTPELAAEQAQRVVKEAAEAGFLPLQWAASALLKNLPGMDAVHWADMQKQCAQQLQERGGDYAAS